MEIERHGLSVGLERTGQEFFLTITATGKLTHADYETIRPLLDNALQAVASPSIKALIDATRLEGWEARAAWDELKLDLKHGRKFEKTAIIGHARWLEIGTKVSSWFVSGEVKLFHDRNEALGWLLD
ncbi:MAG: STAS/SEC14 domain-containing protein [Pseudohongiellaceae bacterium]